MFVRKVKQKNGRTYIQVVDKSSGQYKVLYNVGHGRTDQQISRLVIQGKQWISQQQGIREFDFTSQKEQIETVFGLIDELKLVGLDLLLGRIFDQIGFGQIDDELFKYLVIYRLAFPRSKLKTTEYLYRYEQENWSEDQVYRYLDKLYDKQKEQVQLISYEHTLKVLGGEINIVFYDVTTLYFEIDNEDALRKTGFSEEGKHQNPQIVLGKER